MNKESITFKLNGQDVEAKPGTTILDAALQNGVYIPHLCHHPDLKPAGVCRLCIVEIEGRGIAVSCKTSVEDGMKIRTETPEIDSIRKVAIELLILDNHWSCNTCYKNTQCKLQDIANYVGVDDKRLNMYRHSGRKLAIDSSNPFYERDLNKCILCGICVRTCEELVGANAINYAFRGYDTVISAFANKPVLQSNCVSCGECVARCPVGALVPKTQQKPAHEVKSVCPYCGCGCSVMLGVRGSRIVSVRGDRDGPANRGSLCVKGRFGLGFVNHPDRLARPLIRRDGKLVEAGWEQALGYVAERLSKYRGTDGGFAAVSSAKTTNEENYVFQKFARAVMGTNNIDHCARLCHAPSVAGLAQSFGSGAMTNSIGEIKDAACIFAIGTDTTQTHPIIGMEVLKAVRNGARLIVANPMQIDLCRSADIHIQHMPGTDVALLMGMMRVIVDEDLADLKFINERCENYDAFRKSLDKFDIETVERITGVERQKIIGAARTYAKSKPASILYAMGITQHSHGTDNVLAVGNLAMLTGNIGKPSSGVNPLRGQNNVQGACDMGALPNVYPGYQRVDDENNKKKFESAWGTGLSGSPGLTLTEIFGAALTGKVRAVYIMGENPVLSEPNAEKVLEEIKKLEFLVVQDIFLTETAALADVVLPAAAFAEKDGTFTNTERRVQKLNRAILPPGDSKPDWWIVCEIAKRLGGSGFDFGSTPEIMDEIARVTPGYGGISHERLEKGGIQWPCPAKGHPGTQILHTERCPTPSGKGKFVPLEYKPSAELPDAEYPFILTTCRSLYHYHTGTMTRKVDGLNCLKGHESVVMSGDDAAKLGISDGEVIRVVSRRGNVDAAAQISDGIQPGVVAMTFHFSECPTNQLTNSALDPVAKIPEAKVCAVRLEKLKVGAPPSCAKAH